MTKIKIYTTIVLVLISVLFLVSIIQIKDQYDEKLNKLTKENEKLTKRNHTLEIDITNMQTNISDLNDMVEAKKQVDCGWLQDFYDEFHEEVGAYE